MSTRRVKAPGHRWCEALKTRCPVSDACTAICAVSWSRIFPDQHHIRSCRNTLAAAARTSVQPFPKPGFGSRLEVDTQWIFNRDDLADSVVDLVQRSIKCGGLATASRASHQIIPCGNRGCAEDFSSRSSMPSSPMPRRVRFAAATASPPLPMQHRNHRNTNVHLAVIHFDLERPSWGSRFSAMSGDSGF